MRRACWWVACLVWTGIAFAAPSRPKILEKTAPAYPPAEEAARHGGRVVLHVSVKEDGQVDGVDIMTSTGFPALDQAAVDAAKAWKFAPATDEAGKPVAGEVSFALNFTPPGRDIDSKLTCRELGAQVATLRATAPDATLDNVPALGALMDLAEATDSVLPADVRGKVVASMPKLYDDLLAACANQPDRSYFEVYMELTGVTRKQRK